ncbi:hypothetical protein [Lactococcus garvieae]|uniref:hypothetical protein n=1 Tax=Lactococcus garvieae TaxID=1363 RepID=UPI00254D8A44|nr:hypothetical protein [Lactococcus garvieae]
MAEIQKIYRGMQNGAEIIDDNFKKIDEQVKGLEPIKDTDGWKTTPLLSFNKTSDLYYRIKNDVLYMRLYAAPSEPLAASTNTVIWNIPSEIASRMPKVNFTYAVPNAMGGSNATTQPTFSINYETSTKTIKVYNDLAVTTGHRLAFIIPVPLD